MAGLALAAGRITADPVLCASPHRQRLHRCMLLAGKMHNGRCAMSFGHSGLTAELQDWLAGTLAVVYLGGFIAAIEFALTKLVF
jgi:hypothetical protein